MSVAFIIQRATRIASDREMRFVSIIKSDYTKRENKCRFRRLGYAMPIRRALRRSQQTLVLLALNTASDYRRCILETTQLRTY